MGLLAKNPELRSQVMGNLYESHKLGPVRVVAFTGRESDTPLGVWGAIAEQFGKKEQFNEYYSPLSDLILQFPVLLLVPSLQLF